MLKGPIYQEITIKLSDYIVKYTLMLKSVINSGVGPSRKRFLSINEDLPVNLTKRPVIPFNYRGVNGGKIFRWKNNY